MLTSAFNHLLCFNLMLRAPCCHTHFKSLLRSMTTVFLKFTTNHFFSTEFTTTNFDAKKQARGQEADIEEVTLRRVCRIKEYQLNMGVVSIYRKHASLQE